LPNAIELLSLLDREKVDSSVWLNTQGFTSAPSGQCWASTSDASSAFPGGTAGAWVIDIAGGGAGYATKANAYGAWPVRGPK